MEPVNFAKVIAQTDVEMQRLGWTIGQGREHLKKTYSKRSRTLLTEVELLEFLQYLESQPLDEVVTAKIDVDTEQLCWTQQQGEINAEIERLCWMKEDVVPLTGTGRRKKKTQPADLSDLIANINVAMHRLGWTPEQGREHLIKTYGKRGRTLLTEEELYEFLKYLQSQPDPSAGF
ncbi:hypothetical protein Npun_R6220 [Nostoc punctiforme PCC 73102]|uniref:Uncharacterized protein n=1 Tax=Nostoc punctiforme (strain ATCC 29133 / PCC 73102) TaxID=63737 RepID=B2IW43_NOSP7|nr:hypothetical protein Npun_R6220 [Nostoc punctiforme PCC 73102]